MGQEAGPVDVVVFFDANMPRMPLCSQGCAEDEDSLCAHRFNFVSHVFNRGNLTSLNDWQVIKRFLDLINKNSGFVKKTDTLFVLVTQDHNFIEDVKFDYFDDLQRGETDCVLKFDKDFIMRIEPEPPLKIKVLTINHRFCGGNRETDLRSAIDLLNNFWKSESENPN
ncbi:MAG: hypothetical protein AAB784_02390 [Patescibacteria group bacterium]